MDISKTIELFKERLKITPSIKYYREKWKMKQTELAKLSDVPVRTIRAYEDESLEISKASGETLFKIADILFISMEELIGFKCAD